MPDDYDDVADDKSVALSQLRAQTTDVDNDDDEEEDTEYAEEVEDVEEIFVRVFLSPIRACNSCNRIATRFR